MNPDQQVKRFLELMASMGRRNSLRDPIATSVENLGLTGPQVHALMWLHTDGPLTMGVLALRVGVSGKTVTGLVDSLEEAGFAGRERDGADRRVIRVVLSKTGRRLGRKMEVTIAQKLRLMLSLLEAQDRAALFRILEKLALKLERAAAAGAPSETSK